MDYNDKSSITGWSLPSTKYIDLTLGATASNYIAPANGWFFLTKNVNAANQYIELGDPTNDIAGIRIRTYCPASSGLVMAYIPVHAGHKIYITYNAGGSVGHFRFVYAEVEV